MFPGDILAAGQMQKFYMTGEVVHSVQYSSGEPLTLRKALTLAGGLTNKTANAEIKINRVEDGVVDTMVFEAHASLMPNNVIAVEQAGNMFEEGEVKTGRSLPLRKGDDGAQCGCDGLRLYRQGIE